MVIAALCLTSMSAPALVSLAGPWERFRPLWVLVAFSAYAYVFIRNTAPFPARAPWQWQWLLIQVALSLPFEASLTVVTVLTIPLVLDRRAWWRWFVWTMVAVFSVFSLWIGLNLRAHWRELPAGHNWLEVAGAIGAGLLELAAWHLLAYLAAILIVQFDRDRRRLTQMNAELRGSQVLLMESGRLAERLRISRELHDSLGHHLTSLSLQLEVAEHLPDHQLRPQLRQAQFIAKLVLADIREAVSEWRSETSTALPDALQALTEAIAGTPLVLDVGTDIPATSPTITHALFRCAQEAVTNAMRHGAPRKVTIRLRHQEGSLRMEIEDDGRGVAEVKTGNGLEGMQARLEEIGGAMELHTGLGQGFRVQIRVPLT